MNQAEPEAPDTPGPHRRRDESWEHYINRPIHDDPDADYQDRHQKLQHWVKRHSLPEGLSQQHYDGLTCEERCRVERELPTGLLTVHGSLSRDPFRAVYGTYLDSKGRKFHVDEWEASDRTTEPELVKLPYLLHCPRIGQRPDLNADHCGYFLTDEVSRLGVMKRSDQLISVTSEIDMDHLLGKRVRINCAVEYIREAYYDGDGCYDRVYLAAKEVVEVDLFGYSAEDRKRQEEMFSPGRKARFGDDEFDALA